MQFAASLRKQHTQQERASTEKQHLQSHHCSSTSYGKRRPVPNLRENEETLFRLIKIFFIGEGLWTVVTEPTLGLMASNFGTIKDARSPITSCYASALKTGSVPPTSPLQKTCGYLFGQNTKPSSRPLGVNSSRTGPRTRNLQTNPLTRRGPKSVR